MGMPRSFRTALLVFIVAAATIPVLVVSIPFVLKIYNVTREGAIKELRLTAERIVTDVQHELVFVSTRFVDIGQNKDMVLAASSPFFGFRAIALADEFVKQSTVVEATYLLDADYEVVESIPEITAVADIDRVVDAVRKQMSEPTRFRSNAVWMMVEDEKLLAELDGNRHAPQPTRDKRILVLAMPLFFQHYVQERTDELQGVLIALIPMERVSRFAQRHLENHQSLNLATGLNAHDIETANEQGLQIAQAPLKIDTPIGRPVNLGVQVTEPNAVRFKSVRQTLIYLSLFVLVAAALFCVAAFLLARRLGRPLHQIQEIAQGYAEGNYRPTANVADFDEFLHIAQTLNDMGGRIEKQLEELRTANEQLVLADKLKDDFLANTSHELRTPLHGIIGIASSLLDGAAGELTPKLFRNVRLIEQSGRRLENLVNDILDFSKIKNQALQLEIKPVEIFSLVDIVLSLHAAQAEHLGLKLINAVPRDLPLADADEYRLQQILHNLVGNALKFTPEGEIVVGAQLKDDHVQIMVQDSGVGIPSDKLHSIFEPFVQVEGALTRTRSGSGLGLSISRQLVEMHKGELSVVSTPGQGSTFAFTLPIATDQEADTLVEVRPFASPSHDEELISPLAEGGASALPTEFAANSARAPANSLPKHEANVLIVDDEQINLEILGNYFFNEPYTLHKASSGPEALELLEKLESLDLILLDVMMPKMSGFEVCRIVRANPRFDHVPILFLTARNQAKDIHQGFSLGANDYLVKPISRVELLTRCQYHLHYARVKGELAALNISLEQKVETRTQELQATLGIIQRNNTIFRALLEVSIELQNREELNDSLRSTLGQLSLIFPKRGFGVVLRDTPQSESFKLFSQLPASLEHELSRLIDNGREEWHTEKWLTSKDLTLISLSGRRQKRIGDLVVWPAQMDQNEREVVEIYSRQLSAVVENRRLTEELERLAIMDPLTGAYNRRFFERAFSNVCYTYGRQPDRHFCLLSIDVNGLKHTNDTYGHEAGDTLIVKVVQLLLECLRQTDVVCRIGGDEFVIIAEATGRTSCLTLCERLEEAQKDAWFEVRQEDGELVRLPVRFSVGSASTEDTRPEELLRVADQRMYERKQQFYIKNGVLNRNRDPLPSKPL